LQLSWVISPYKNSRAFTACSFRFLECLARAAQSEKAQLLFEKLLGYDNHLGLYSNELGANGQHLGVSRKHSHIWL